MNPDADCLPGTGFVFSAAERSTAACAASGAGAPRVGFGEPDRDRPATAVMRRHGAGHLDQSDAARDGVTELVDMTTGVRGGAPDAGRVLDGGGSVNGTAEATATVRLVCALSPPLRLIVWPVKTWVVEVPAESVSVSVAV